MFVGVQLTKTADSTYAQSKCIQAKEAWILSQPTLASSRYSLLEGPRRRHCWQSPAESMAG